MSILVWLEPEGMGPGDELVRDRKQLLGGDAASQRRIDQLLERTVWGGQPGPDPRTREDGGKDAGRESMEAGEEIGGAGVRQRGG